MKKHLLRTAACALILGGLAACQSDDIAYSDNMSPEELTKELDKRFDFNSYESLPLKLRFSPFENVSIYEVDPTENPDVKPFFSAMVNSVGTFDMNLPFAAHLIGKTVWAKGMNGVMKGTLTKKGIEFVSSSRAITITGLDGDEGLCWKLMEVSNHHLKEGFDNREILADQMLNIDIQPVKEEGKPDDEQGTEVMVAMIDHGDGYGVQLYYYYYDLDRESSIPLDDQLKSQFNGFSEFATKFINNKYRLFPKATESDPNPWMNGDETNWNNKEKVGQTAQLKYYGSNYQEEGIDVFPQGVGIGFILVNEQDGYWWAKLTTGGAYLYRLDYGNTTPTATGWSDALYEKSDEMYRYAAAMDIDDLLENGEDYSAYGDIIQDYTHWVYTFEDNTDVENGDKDMNDVKFLAVIKGGVDPTVPKIIDADGTLKGYYCFEDLYPDQAGGDYDLNDVVVSYEYNYALSWMPGPTSAIHGISIFNYMIKPIHDGATYTNNFHLEYLPYPGYLSTTGTHNVYNNHKAQLSQGKIFTGSASATYDPAQRKYTGTKSRENDEFAKAIIYSNPTHIMKPTPVSDLHAPTGYVSAVAGISPYIFCENTGKEVHLSKFYMTGLNGGSFDGSTSLESWLLAHYLTTHTAGDSYRYCPFAIDIPYVEGKPLNFSSDDEGTPIYVTFPRFVEWVESEGDKAKDWYIPTYTGSEETAE